MADPSWPANRTIDTSILIDAPLSKVRSILLDFATYPTWSRFIQKVELAEPDKPVAIGSKLRISLLPPGGSAMDMAPNVVKLDDGGFGWHGHLANINGLFDGKHLFLLSEENGQTKLIQREEFGGFLYAPIMNWLGNEAKTKAGFVEFNEAVKRRAEQT
jgi:hypothetical protein